MPIRWPFALRSTVERLRRELNVSRENAFKESRRRFLAEDDAKYQEQQMGKMHLHYSRWLADSHRDQLPKLRRLVGADTVASWLVGVGETSLHVDTIESSNNHGHAFCFGMSVLVTDGTPIEGALAVIMEELERVVPGLVVRHYRNRVDSIQSMSVYATNPSLPTP